MQPLNPAAGSQFLGGHAIAAGGYDDNHAIGTEQGTLIVRNSSGSGWGLNGYVCMSYRYVTTALANDWWTMTKQERLDTGSRLGVERVKRRGYCS
jgi:C1A family cysteine protease